MIRELEKNRFICFGLFISLKKKNMKKNWTRLLNLLFWKFGGNFTGFSRFVNTCRGCARSCFSERDANWNICWFRLSKHCADNSTKPRNGLNTQRHWKTLANTKQNTFPLYNQQILTPAASVRRHTLSCHYSTAPIIVLILLPLQLSFGCFIFCLLLGFILSGLGKCWQ